MYVYNYGTVYYASVCCLGRRTVGEGVIYKNDLRVYRRRLQLIRRLVSFALKEAEKEGPSKHVVVVCCSSLSESVVVIGKKDNDEGDDQEEETTEEGPGITATVIRAGTGFRVPHSTWWLR